MATNSMASGPGGVNRLRLSNGAIGYQGNFTNKKHEGGGMTEGQSHAADIGAVQGSAKFDRTGIARRVKTHVSRGGVILGGTVTPKHDEQAMNTGKETPRHGFNFGIHGNSKRHDGGIIGGLCGLSLMSRQGGNFKAYTRSTAPGNRLEVDLGVSGGVGCAFGDTLIAAQYLLDGNLGVEQMQNLEYQQGNRRYDAKKGNGLLLYADHGPQVLIMHDGHVIGTLLSAEYRRSIGKGRWGGERQILDAQAIVTARTAKARIGFGPWYQFQRVNYDDDSKVDPENRNTTSSHTFGASLVVRGARGAR